MPGSAQYRRSKKKKRSHTKFISGFFALILIAGCVLFFVCTLHEDTKNKFEKLNYPIKYSQYVEKAAIDYNLEPALIYAVIRTESGFNPEAESGAGACGIMQMMPSSFEWLQQQRGEENSYTTEDLFDPAICIDYGSYLLSYFMEYYGNERCAVAAYNAGFVVSDWLADSSCSSDGKTLYSIPYEETSNYVDRVESAKEMYIKLYYS